MSTHLFDVEVAKEVGVIPAIIYHNIRYWCDKNRANGVNLVDGYTWSYNSNKAFRELFPYLTASQIRTAIDKLVEKKFILVSEFNQKPFDHTKWYADIRVERIAENRKSNCEESQIELSLDANRIATDSKPIPDINTNINTDINTKVSKKGKAKEPSFDEILDSDGIIAFDPELREKFIEFIRMRVANKKPLTNYALKLIISKTRKYANDNPELMKKIIDRSTVNSWRDVYELPKENNDNPFDKKISSNDPCPFGEDVPGINFEL